ncbi:hypothetical protein Z517_01521 [Fonsecaea pedrosoi CBS 271.37]|uniref:Uncharacterized protein n=1 Tax=Fonsecaea pedrosoi CBS 271.37 TaxID=1442368 RepID=A0A0D2FHH8_9EURO|nr:uncharacterized protein Z517_01521 [Fonsecaea pedrosoi CBS 271.37]KIW86127.1 hypothetical protein Z517_01521 [Fonsecaea pedrosoi CBS 271.37]
MGFDLKDKVAIITGSSSGMGFETTKLLLELGATVYGFDIDKAPELFIANPKFKSHQGDIAEPGTPKAIVDGAVAAFGRIDILCNVAGISDTFNGLDTLEEQAWHRQLGVNLTGPTWLCKAVVDVFRKQGGGGAIVNVSSKAGTSGAICGVAYTAAKHGLVGVTKNIAWRYHEEGIRCNAICPGGYVSGIKNKMDFSKLDHEAMKVYGKVQELHLKGALDVTGPPDRPARLMAFLVSDWAVDINGAIIPIDNAWSTI